MFRAARPFISEGEDPFASGLGGTEQAVIGLTTALASLGEDVAVAGGSTRPRTLSGVTWGPDAPETAGVTVAINDATLLPARPGLPAVWFHNEVELLKETRRRRLPALLRHRPTAVFIGAVQARRASALLPFRSRQVIPYGLSPAVLAAAPASAPPPPSALFTSQAYRGLREVLAWWQRAVAPSVPDARFEALIAAADLPHFAPLCTAPGVSVGPRLPNAAVLERLRRTRVLIVPGHRSETFCMAAAEAVAMGVPVITRGWGSLSERVRDGETGFICRSEDEMAARTRALLTNDSLWLRMHRACLAGRDGQGWESRAQAWREAVTGMAGQSA